MTRWRRHSVSVLCFAAALGATPVGALAQGAESPYRFNAGVDISLPASALFIVGVPYAFRDEILTADCLPNCDPSKLNALDRATAGRYDPDILAVSDALFVTMIAAPFLAGIADVELTHPQDGYAGYGRDSAILAQTLALDLAATAFINMATRRARPYVYNDSLPDSLRSSGDGALSFPSGHTSGSFAMASAYSLTYSLRHPKSPLVVPVWLLTHSLAATVGWLRVEGGKHFPSDVIVGALLGTAVGLAVPALHLR